MMVDTALELSLQQAIEGIHSGSIKKLERTLNIGGIDYAAKIYGLVAQGVIRIDISVQKKREV